MRMFVESNNSIAIDNPASVDKGSQLLHCDGDKILQPTNIEEQLGLPRDDENKQGTEIINVTEQCVNATVKTDTPTEEDENQR